MAMRFFIFVGALLFAESAGADPVRVLVWDERQPKQKQAYDNFLGNEIVARLSKNADQCEFRSVALDDPEQGVSIDNLQWADVVVWWGHARHSDLTRDNSQRVLDHIISGDLDLIALHSAHWARPFVGAMNWRSMKDAQEHLQTHMPDLKFTFESVEPPRERTVPTHGSVLTPAWFGYKKNRIEAIGVIHLPYCCFPDFRPDGKPGTLKVKSAGHPIVRGLPSAFRIPQTEMYNEPFHVPEPDELIFEETWELGERFRSGMVWNIGEGKVFYFRPGHETYAVFKQPEVLKVIENAAIWLGRD